MLFIPLMIVEQLGPQKNITDGEKMPKNIQFLQFHVLNENACPIKEQSIFFKDKHVGEKHIVNQV